MAFETLPSAACRTPKRVAKCGSCLSLGNPLRRWRVPDGQICGVVKCETSFPAATICGDRAFRTPKHVAKCKFGEARRSPFARNEGQQSKTLCKIVILKVQMHAWHESQTAITVGKRRFFNVRFQRSRIGVKLRLYPFLKVRHNRFARNKTCAKLQFYKGVAYKIVKAALCKGLSLCKGLGV